MKTHSDYLTSDEAALTMRVLDIVSGTSVDGPGMRTSIYFAGCRHACPGCHNPQSHDFTGGKAMTLGEILERILDDDENVTFSGGDPLFQDQKSLCTLARAIVCAGYNIWCFTGFLFEQVHTMDVMQYVDVLVDGPFVQALSDKSLLFRGSSNQRLVDLKSSTPDRVVFWQSPF